MEKNLEELLSKRYKNQSVKLSSDQISSILNLYRRSINRLRVKGMDRMADSKEDILRSIIDKLE